MSGNTVQVAPQRPSVVRVTTEDQTVEVLVTPPPRVIVTAPGPQGPRGPVGSSDGAGSSVVNVMTHGAVGDGVTDDTDAIDDAIAEAGIGGTVYFPVGEYLTTRPIEPLRQQILRGSHANKYSAAVFPFVQCSIKADPDNFTGDSVIRSTPTSYGVEVSHLAIIGTGPDDINVVHGVYFGTSAEGEGERAWNIKDCLISSCSGDGIGGHMWVFDMRDTHVAQCRNGLATSGSDGLLDARIIGSQFYFNRDGGIVLDGGWTGAIDIIGCRVERSGNLYGYPATPLNPDAPGIRIRRGQQVALTNVNTDANTGVGLHIGHPSSSVYNILITGCSWVRDGGGTQNLREWWDWVADEYVQVADNTPGADIISGEGIPGVWLDRCFHVKMTNSLIGYGKSDDGSAEGPISPSYGLRANDTAHCEVVASRVETLPFSRALDVDPDTNSDLNLNLPAHQLMKVPVAGEAQWLPTTRQIGLIAYQNDLQSLVVQNYDGDWRAMLSYDPAYPLIRLPKIVDLYSDSGDGDSLLRVVKGGPDSLDGYGLLRWTMGTNSATYGHTWFLARYGDNGAGNLEAYIDSPVAVRRDNGTVETNQLFTRPTGPDRMAAQFRGRASQTANIVAFELDDGSAVAGVTSDGRVWGADAVAADDYINLGQLQTVVAASSDFADFQTRIAAL